jgi:hypothetical protein
VRAIPRFIEAELPVESVPFEIRQEKHAPAVQGPAVLVTHRSRREPAVHLVVVLEGAGDLLNARGRMDPALPVSDFLSAGQHHDTAHDDEGGGG